MTRDIPSTTETLAVIDHRVATLRIERPANAVYDFASRMENLPQWASGLASGIERVGDAWFTESPMGRVKVAMAPRNAFGVLDHDVTLPDGRSVHNALRVSPAGDAASIVGFIVLRLADATPEAFAADVAQVQKDLEALKRWLEGAAGDATERSR